MTEETEEVQEVAQTEQEQQVETPEVQEAIKQEVSRNDERINWERANEVLKMQKKQIEELTAQLSQQASKQEVVEEPDEFDKLDPEDYLKVATAKELAKKVAAKEAAVAARQIVQEYAQQQAVLNDEQRMRSKYEDYDYVVENFALPLIKNDPALAYKIQNSKNPAETAYKLGKLNDSYEENMQKQPSNPKADKIIKNSQRPASGNAAGSPLKSQADQFSKMSKEEIWSMSQKFARGA